MNAFDCAASKRGDTKAWISTLAPEYVDVEANGSRTPYKDLVAGEDAAPQTKVTSCSTVVSSVSGHGDRYALFGTYNEEGVIIKSKQRYRMVQRIRDSWRRAGGQWKQTESVAYEVTIWVNGKLAEHHVLPARY